MMVSLNGAAAGANEEAQGALITSQDQQRRPYKSYRKKYRKLRMDFEASMDEAVELFDAEQKARDTAQRLQEQNDQILEILLDLNSNSSTMHRFNLSSPPPTPTIPDFDLEASSSVTIPSIHQIERYTTFTPHNLPSPSILPTDLSTIHDIDSTVPNNALLPPSFMTPAHETEYLSTLDTALAACGSEPTTLGSAAKLCDVKRCSPAEHRFALLHPASTYNWLKHNRPGVMEDHPPPNDEKRNEDARSRREDIKHVRIDGSGEFDGSARTVRRSSELLSRPTGGGGAKRKREEKNGIGAANGLIKKRRTDSTEDDSQDDGFGSKNGEIAQKSF